MQELTDLGLPDPLWEPLSDWTPFAEARVTGSGIVEGVGLPRFSWRFNELSLTQVGALLYYVSEAGVLQASRWVYVRTRIAQSNMTARVFQSYKALMLCPFEPKDLRYTKNRRYENITVQFMFAEAI